MRHLFIIYLVASSLSVSGFCQTPTNQRWFNKKTEEQEKALKERNDRFEEAVKQYHKITGKNGEESDRQYRQRLEESQRRMEERKKEFEKSDQDFRERWEANKRKSKEFFEKRENEFDQFRERFIKDLQKQRERQEQEEAEQVKEVIITQCGVGPQNTHAELNSQGQCFNCLSEDLSQDPKILVFMSFSIPDSAWINLSQELERVGGAFVLRGLPNQSFQALASRILNLKEQGVNAPIQLDPKSFFNFEINQVPTIVAVDEQAFDKVSGHISLKFALEKMAEHGETKIAKTLYQAFKGQGQI